MVPGGFFSFYLPLHQFRCYTSAELIVCLENMILDGRHDCTYLISIPVPK